MTRIGGHRLFLALSLGLALLLPARTTFAQAADAPQHRTSPGGDEASPASQPPVQAQREEDENDVYRHSATVRYLARKFGLTPEQAATSFEFLNFFVLAGLVIWLLARVLPKAFRTRSSGIQRQLLDARAATEQASARLNNVEDRLERLDGQIASMRDQFEKDAVAEETRMRASVEAEKGNILAAAEQEIQSATAEARRQLQQYAAELAIEQAARKLVVSAETDRLLIQNFARRLGSTGNEGEN